MTDWVSMESEDWPFEEDPDTQVITLRQIVDGEMPILSVFRDISDRGWQFLIGEEEPEVDDGRRADLHCMYIADPSIADLADLPLGWFAWRDKPGEPWQRATHHADEWDELVGESMEALSPLQTRLEDQHALSAYKSVELDVKSGTAVFTTPGRPTLEADVLIVGSLTRAAGTAETSQWRWAWADPEIHEDACGGLENIAEYGRSVGLKRLSKPTWPATDADAWEVTAIAAAMLDADGAYRVPIENGTMFVLLSGLEPPE